MTVQAHRDVSRGARPVSPAGSWRSRPGSLGPCRTMSGKVVAMAYQTTSGTWSWVVAPGDRVVSSGMEYATEAASRAGADDELLRHGIGPGVRMAGPEGFEPSMELCNPITV